MEITNMLFKENWFKIIVILLLLLIYIKMHNVLDVLNAIELNGNYTDEYLYDIRNYNEYSNEYLYDLKNSFSNFVLDWYDTL